MVLLGSRLQRPLDHSEKQLGPGVAVLPHGVTRLVFSGL